MESSDIMQRSSDEQVSSLELWSAGLISSHLICHLPTHCPHPISGFAAWEGTGGRIKIESTCVRWESLAGKADQQNYLAKLASCEHATEFICFTFCV